MLSKKFRLDPKKIPFVARSGKRRENDLIILKSISDEHLANPFLAISISIKIDKRAVVRNRIKRKIRAVLRELLDDNKIKNGLYLVIVKTDKIAETDNIILKEKIEGLL